MVIGIPIATYEEKYHKEEDNKCKKHEKDQEKVGSLLLEVPMVGVLRMVFKALFAAEG